MSLALTLLASPGALAVAFSVALVASMVLAEEAEIRRVRARRSADG